MITARNGVTIRTLARRRVGLGREATPLTNILMHPPRREVKVTSPTRLLFDACLVKSSKVRTCRLSHHVRKCEANAVLQDKDARLEVLLLVRAERNGTQSGTRSASSRKTGVVQTPSARTMVTSSCLAALMALGHWLLAPRLFVILGRILKMGIALGSQAVIFLTMLNFRRTLTRMMERITSRLRMMDRQWTLPELLLIQVLRMASQECQACQNGKATDGSFVFFGVAQPHFWIELRLSR